jgi:hypothetical protein
MEDDPTPPSKDGLEKLVELMAENNRATSEIERDGRNTRRHLLEMKKIQQASLNMSDSVNTGFENFFETMNANKLSDEENATERASIFEEIRDELTEIREGGLDTRSDDSKGSSGGGGGGGFMKMLGGAGLGVGAAAVGVAAVFASSAYLIKTIENMDGKKIVQNVDDLLGISRLNADEGAAAEVFGTLVAIGAGLLVFSAGSSAAALSQGVIDKFEGGGWPEAIKQNVAELLSIADLEGMSVKNVAGVAATLGALGAGLLAFSAGTATGAAVTGVAEAIEDFSGNAGFAKSIKDNVETLLSIDTSGGGVFKALGLAATMGALAFGLIAFSVGSATAVAVDGADAAIDKFAGSGNWAKSVKDNVETLLSIDTSGGSSLEIAGTMAALAFGLIAFSAGSATAVAVDGATAAIDKFAGSGNWAENIVSNITTLLSIADLSFGDVLETTGALGSLGAGLAAFGVGTFFAGVGDAASSADSIVSEVNKLLAIGETADKERTLAATGALTSLGVGLAAFAAGKGVVGLADLGTSIVSFFTGSKSPIEQAIEVGEKADTIQAGADAFSNFADVFERMSAMGKISIEMDDVDEAVANFNRIQGILNMNTPDGTSIDTNRNTTGALNMEMSDGTSIDTYRNTTGAGLMTISAENVDLRTNQTSVQPAASTIISSSDNSKKSSTFISQKPAAPDRTAEGVSMR